MCRGLKPRQVAWCKSGWSRRAPSVSALCNTYLAEPPGDGEAPPGVEPAVPAGALELAPPVSPGVEPVVALPGVVPPLGGVVELPAAPPAVPAPLLEELAPPGALAVPGLLGLVPLGGGVVLLAPALGLPAELLAVPEVSAPPAAGAVSFLPHPPNARAATNAPSNIEYFIFMLSPLK
jgi:hypothetical protein